MVYSRFRFIPLVSQHSLDTVFPCTASSSVAENVMGYSHSHRRCCRIPGNGQGTKLFSLNLTATYGEKQNKYISLQGFFCIDQRRTVLNGPPLLLCLKYFQYNIIKDRQTRKLRELSSDAHWKANVVQEVASCRMWHVIIFYGISVDIMDVWFSAKINCVSPNVFIYKRFYSNGISLSRFIYKCPELQRKLNFKSMICYDYRMGSKSWSCKFAQKIHLYTSPKKY